MRKSTEDIMELGKSFFKEQFAKSSRETILYCEEHSKEIAKEFLNSLVQAVNLAIDSQERGEKEAASYLLFSHLYSSMFLQDYRIRINIMDQRCYSDLSETETYWNANCLYGLFEKDLEEIRKKMEQQVFRVHEHEMDQIRFAYYPYYHQLAKSFIREMLSVILEDENFFSNGMTGEEPLKILFGEYMGQAEILFTLAR